MFCEEDYGTYPFPETGPTALCHSPSPLPYIALDTRILRGIFDDDSIILHEPLHGKTNDSISDQV